MAYLIRTNENDTYIADVMPLKTTKDWLKAMVFEADDLSVVQQIVPKASLVAKRFVERLNTKG